MKRVKQILIAVAIVAALAIVALYILYKQVLDYKNEPVSLKTELIFTVPAGTGRIALETLLVQQKVIESNDSFQWLLKLEPDLAQFKAGTYRINPDITIGQLLELLSSGKEAQFSIRFIEGSKLSDWTAQLRDAPYIKHESDTKSLVELNKLFSMRDGEALEGWFYPDTYHYTANTSDIEILKRANQKMKGYLDEEWKGRDKNLPYKSAYEMLIMASIIEKETGVGSERTLVASVFTNRLKQKMRLQTDPSVIYGLGDKYRGTIYRSDLNNYTDYNTYQIDGLPPTPIAMPGSASIKAAAHPDKTDYLYFVADGKGGHTFSRSLNEHNRAVKVYRQIQAQN